MGVERFTDEERVLINQICKNEKLSTLTKADVLKTVMFSQQVAGDDDDMVSDLLEEVFDKLKDMTDAEWDELKMLVPLPVAINPEDDVSEVPDDQEYEGE